MTQDKEYITVKELIEKLNQLPEELWVYYAENEVEYEGIKHPVYGFLDFNKMNFVKIEVKTK